MRAPVAQSRASTCVACGPTAAALVHVEGPYRIVRCQGCELIYVDGSSGLEGLEEFYGEAYFSGSENAVSGFRDYVADRALHLRNAHDILAALERHVPSARGRRLLDVGCAHGFLLQAAQARSWQPWGVDISPAAVEYARRELGLMVHRGGVEDCPFPAESFDAACMIGTIEHMTDPVKTLRGTARLLKPGGFLLITTMDVEGRLGYFSWKPPEHLFYFSSRSLAHCLDRAGFASESSRTYWKRYSIADLATRLWGFWHLPQAGRVGRLLEALLLHRARIKIPTNEVLVVARKR